MNKNQTTKEILKLVEYQIEQIFTEVEKIKEDNRAAHDEVKDDLRFIKNNLFDPKEGIWTEVKENSNFRKERITRFSVATKSFLPQREYSINYVSKWF